MYVVLHDRVVEDGVALFQRIFLLAIHNLNLALHHVDEFLTLVGRELEIGTLFGIDVDDERLHVAAGLLLCQRVILHVLAGVGGSVRETDAAGALTVGGTAYNGAQCVVVVHEGAQPYAQCACDFDERTQRRQVLSFLNRDNLFFGKAAAF